MFFGCSSLISLNLLNFDTSIVECMNDMFSGCSSLTSLNLSNFIISNIIFMNNMFSDCLNLEYINIISFKKSNSEIFDHYDIFINIPENIVVCVIKDNIQNIYPKIENKTCYVEDCTDDWKLKQKKIINGTNQCINNCSDSNLYEYNGKCYSNCQNEYYYDNNNYIKCKCELEKCRECPNVALNKKLCTKCNVNYYPIENDPLNIGDYFNCYNKSPNGYYLDINDSLYKKYYESCETCEAKGDNVFHNCLICNTEFNFKININMNNYTNCYFF